ncbi:MAG: cell division protein FtsA [Bacteroidetes bacterium]|nr:MAG: cell division protein FtsA [Bacteroidota bacterium]
MSDNSAEQKKKKSPIVVGLDIGTTKIACFVGRKNEHGKIEILSMGRAESLGVTRGMVANIDKTIQSIKSAVQEAEERIEGQLVIKTVNVGIAGQHIKSLQHRGIHTRSNVENEISQADIDRLIDDMYRMAMPPGEQIITVLPQEYIVDSEQGIKDPIGMSGVRLEANFHIITGNVGACLNINKCVERSGLHVDDIILEPIASAESVLTEEEKEAGVVLVDIGGGTTDIAIFHEGIIRHTAVIPFGGNVITEDIKEGCTIMKRHAEKLKQQFGSALVSESQENEVVAIPGLKGRAPKEITLRNLAGIIQARMEEIIELVHYEIRNSGYEKKLIAGIVVTGGGSQLKHITQLFEYMTGMDTRIGYPTEHLANTNNEVIKSPIYATGIGLVMKGFESLELKSRSEEPEAASAGEVATSSTQKRGTFFESIIKKSIGFFNEKDEEVEG